MKHLYTLVLLFIISGMAVKGQEQQTDKILIEFMKPGDPDAQARNYNLLPWPEEAKASAYKAAEIWASYLEITVPIRVKFGWCDNISAAGIGSPMLSYQYTDNNYYPLALINQLLGYDKNSDTADIICVFNSNINVGWYFGIDGDIGLTPDPNNPGVQYFQMDFLTTALHEVCHGLGLVTTMTINNGIGSWGGSVSGKTNIYDTFIVDKNGYSLVDESHYKKDSKELANILTSDNIYWSGSYALLANNKNAVKINAPSKWIDRNSICHIDGIYYKTENSLMSGIGFEGGEHQHFPGSIVLGMLQDIGWTLKSGATTATNKIQLESPVKVYTSGYEIVIEGCKQTDKVMIYDFSGNVRSISYGPGQIYLPSGLFIVRVADKTYKVKL